MIFLNYHNPFWVRTHVTSMQQKYTQSTQATLTFLSLFSAQWKCLRCVAPQSDDQTQSNSYQTHESIEKFSLLTHFLSQCNEHEVESSISLFHISLSRASNVFALAIIRIRCAYAQMQFNAIEREQSLKNEHKS